MSRLAAPLLAAFALLIAFGGCPKRVTVKPPDNAPAALDSALAALERKQYGKCEEAFTWVIFNFPGSREASDAQYWLAESYLRRGDNIQAQTEFEFYVHSFPNGRYQEESQLKLGLAWLRSAPGGARDQAPLLKAQEVLRDFALLHPESELQPRVDSALAEIDRRMTGRDFNVARLYYRAGEYRSAGIYYQVISDSLPVDRWEPVDRLRFAVCRADVGTPELARPLLESLLTESTPADIRQQARQLLERLE